MVAEVDTDVYLKQFKITGYTEFDVIRDRSILNALGESLNTDHIPMPPGSSVGEVKPIVPRREFVFDANYQSDRYVSVISMLRFIMYTGGATKLPNVQFDRLFNVTHIQVDARRDVYISRIEIAHGSQPLMLPSEFKAKYKAGISDYAIIELAIMDYVNNVKVKSALMLIKDEGSLRAVIALCDMFGVDFMSLVVKAYSCSTLSEVFLGIRT